MTMRSPTRSAQATTRSLVSPATVSTRATKRLPPAGTPAAGIDSSAASASVAPVRSTRTSANGRTPGAWRATAETVVTYSNAMAVSFGRAPAGTDSVAAPDVTVTASLPPALRAPSRPARTLRRIRPSSSSPGSYCREGTMGTSAASAVAPASGVTKPSTSAR